LTTACTKPTSASVPVKKRDTYGDRTLRLSEYAIKSVFVWSLPLLKCELLCSLAGFVGESSCSENEAEVVDVTIFVFVS
jgi:hypothetical protein